MRSLTNPAGLALVVLLALSFSASRVCFASIANFTANTAIGLCSHSVLHTLRVGANGTIAYITTATTTQSTVLKLLPTYCNRRLAYPYLEPYLAVVGSGTEGPVATILSNPTIRANYIRALITFMKSYPRCVGLFIDFSNLTTSQAAGYAAFMQALFQAAGTASLKLASALPWEADRYADVYYSVTLRSLSFNVLRTYDEFYSTLTTIVRPLNPLVAMAAPFNATTKTISYNLYRWIIKGLNPSNIILGISMYGRAFTVTKVSQFGATGTASASVVSYCDFGLQTSSSGESISSSSSMAYVFTSFQSAELKLNFAVSNNLAGVALFSLNTAGTNAELLRYVTSIIAPTPPTGFQYPVASYPTCGVSITFPSLPPQQRVAVPLELEELPRLRQEETPRLLEVERQSLEVVRLLREEVQQPLEEVQQPLEGELQPLEEAQQPLEEDQLLLEEELLPLEEARLPLEPLEEDQQPLEEAQQPLEEVQQPLEEAQQPLEEAQQPLEEDQQPLEEARLLLEEDQLLLEEDQQPLEEVQQPLEEDQQPLEEDQQPLEVAPRLHHNLLLFAALLCGRTYPSEISAQRSRVCFAQSGDYSTATSIGFCSHAVYIALNPTSKAFVGILNPANDADDLLGGIRKFANLKKTYPYVDLYMGVLGSISAGNILWLNQQASRKTFIDLLITKMASYPEMSGVYLDFDGLTNLYQNWYALFVAELNTALTAKNLKLITALPWDASASGDIYYSSTLSTLPFNVIKTHEEMYSAVATTSTRPISPLFSLAAPFNDETKTIALLFGSKNTLGAPQAGEGFAYSSSTFYTYNTPASLVDKLQFVIATNMGGVGVYSLDQAGSQNAEMLRQVTSVLAPTPPASVSYPPEEVPLLLEEAQLLLEEVPLLQEEAQLLLEEVQLLLQEVPLLQEEAQLLQEVAPLLQEEVPLLLEEVQLLQEVVPLLQEEVPLLLEEVPLLQEEAQLLQEVAPLLLEEVPLLQEEAQLLREEVPLLQEEVQQLLVVAPLLLEEAQLLQEVVQLLQEVVLLLQEEAPLLQEEVPLLLEEAQLLLEEAQLLLAVVPLLLEEAPLLQEVVPLLQEEAQLLQEEVPLLQEAIQQLLVVAPLLQEEVPLLQEEAQLLQEVVPLLQEEVQLLQEVVPLLLQEEAQLLREEVPLLQEVVPLPLEVVQQLLVVAPLLLEEALLHQTQHRQLRHQPVHHQPRLQRQLRRLLRRLLLAILR
uniref:GH18 domain-containing protein n=1 Tax=Anopheles arabiensis TaxID=7173 RepID=A0A182I9L7_ANOAR